MKENITPKERCIISAIEEHTSKHGSPPSYRELMAYLGYKSIGSIYRFVLSLKKKGVIKDLPRSWRSTELLTTTKSCTGDVIEIEIIGGIVKAKPPELFPKSHTTTIPSHLVGKDAQIYGLIIQDASFVEEHILPGDLILVEPSNEASPGDLVLASTQKSIIGHFFEEGAHIRFRSSPYSTAGAVSSIVVKAEDTQIWGIIVGLIRMIGHG